MSTEIGKERFEQLRSVFGKWLRTPHLFLAVSVGMTVLTYCDSPLLRVDFRSRGVIALFGSLSLIVVVFTTEASDHYKNLLHGYDGKLLSQ